jgi:hypothetical protein
MPTDGTDECAAPEGDGTHPAGEIRLSPTRAIGLRVSALGGLAVGAIMAATPAFPAAGTHTTSAP